MKMPVTIPMVEKKIRKSDRAKGVRLDTLQ